VPCVSKESQPRPRRAWDAGPRQSRHPQVPRTLSLSASLAIPLRLVGVHFLHAFEQLVRAAGARDVGRPGRSRRRSSALGWAPGVGLVYRNPSYAASQESDEPFYVRFLGQLRRILAIGRKVYLDRILADLEGDRPPARGPDEVAELADRKTAREGASRFHHTSRRAASSLGSGLARLRPSTRARTTTPRRDRRCGTRGRTSGARVAPVRALFRHVVLEHRPFGGPIHMAFETWEVAFEVEQQRARGVDDRTHLVVEPSVCSAAAKYDSRIS